MWERLSFIARTLHDLALLPTEFGSENQAELATFQGK
jgi:hypothetical protein